MGDGRHASRYEQPDQEGIETVSISVSFLRVRGRYEQPDQEGIETIRDHLLVVQAGRRYEQPDQEGIETGSRGLAPCAGAVSLRAARSRGHRNGTVEQDVHSGISRYEQPEQEGIETGAGTR